MAAERGGCSLETVSLPPDVRESLAELELELSEGDITQKGYEKKRAKLLARYLPLVQGVDPSLQAENRVPGSSQATAAVSKQQKSRSINSRDERFRSGYTLPDHVNGSEIYMRKGTKLLPQRRTKLKLASMKGK